MLVTALLIALIAGVVLWMVPMDETMRRITIGVAVIVVLLLIFASFGLIPMPRFR